MRFLAAVVLIEMLVLAGCGNSGNPNAPVSNAPHETSWVTYHRNSIIKDAAFSNVSAAALINEHVTQCRVCHGAGLMGAKAGDAGPACLDCHVLDPVRFPILCYSCHGRTPMVNPQAWYSTNRAKRPGLPLDLSFFSRVRNNSDVHLKHKAVSGLSNIPVTTANLTKTECKSCHGDRTVVDWLGEAHHVIAMNKDPKLGCMGPLPAGCHTFGFNNGQFVLLTPKCEVCHTL